MEEKVLVAPSVLSANFARLGEDLTEVASADLIHYDVMDGHFVPNISFGVEIAKQVHAATEVPLDVHLMVTNPEEVAPWFIKTGASYVTFHWEAQTHAHRLVSLIHDGGAKAGIALNPATPVSCLESIIDDLDLVLIMTVNPGFGGQSFIEHSYNKLQTLSKLCRAHGVNPLVEVDGGISAANAEKVVRAGARALVAGSSVFGTDDRAAAIAAIRDAGERGLRKEA